MNTYEKARNLRKNMTKQERILWKFLRKKSINNLKFRRQYPIGNYIVDFICNKKNLIIEIDGGQHNENQNIIYDQVRTNYLESKGTFEQIITPYGILPIPTFPNQGKVYSKIPSPARGGVGWGAVISFVIPGCDPESHSWTDCKGLNDFNTL